jgi:hypothetical protein
MAAGFELGIAAAGSAAAPADEQVLTFSTAVGKSGADYLAQVIAAASYALEAGARLDDPQAGERSEGDAILATLARQLTQFPTAATSTSASPSGSGSRCRASSAQPCSACRVACFSPGARSRHSGRANRSR